MVGIAGGRVDVVEVRAVGRVEIEQQETKAKHVGVSLEAEQAAEITIKLVEVAEVRTWENVQKQQLKKSTTDASCLG